MSADGKNIKQDTKFLLTTTPLGGFCLEVESPGNLSQQRTFYLADYTSKHLTYAMLDSFMGPNALDPVAQLDIGACFLYFANGFKLDNGEDDPRRLEESEELLRNSDLYFHPSGVLMAPEGQTIPGMKAMPGDDDDDDDLEKEENVKVASIAAASGAASAPLATGTKASVPESGGDVRSSAQPQPATAALILSRHNFSLPQFRRSCGNVERGVDAGCEGEMHRGFRPQEAVRGLLGHLGKLRLGWRHDS
jgi:hypothetical protein